MSTRSPAAGGEGAEVEGDRGPGDAAVAQAELQVLVAVADGARVHDGDAAREEHRLRVADAERADAREPADLFAAQLAQRQVAVDLEDRRELAAGELALGLGDQVLAHLVEARRSRR